MKKMSKFTFIVFLISASTLAACSQVAASTAEPSTPAATQVLLPATTPFPLPAAADLAPGTYFFPHRSISDYQRIIFTLPAGWSTSDGFVYKHLGQSNEMAFSAWVPDQVYADPCHWQGSVLGPLDLAIHYDGTTGEYLLTPADGGLANQAFRGSLPLALTQVMLGGERALRIDLSVPADLDISSCDNGEFRSWTDSSAVGGANSHHASGQLDAVYEVDLDRKALVIDASHMPETSDADLAELEAILASIIIDRGSPVDGTYTLGHFPDVPTGSFSDSTVSSLQAVLDAAVKQRGLPGVTATVLVADRGAWSGAAGTADGMNPMQIRSQFAIASLTKTVIASQIMWLSEQGILRLSDPVSDHLPPSFHFDTNGATIENLLSMESGIPDPALSASAPEVLADPLRYWTPEEILASVPAQRNKPGDHFVYEDANYMLLGLVIRETSGMSVSAALRSHILADPRLSSLVYQPEERPEGPFALPFLGGHVRSNILEVGGGYLPTRSDASDGNGSGCMASDSQSLALWGYLLFGRDLLTEQSLLAMSNFGQDIAQGGVGPYGLGVIDQTNLANGFGVKAIGNAGWDDGGYATELTIIPSEGIVISVMTNKDGDPKALVIPIAQKLASILQK
jgi:D-alanyl-D-alanine carboxypeptidase